MKHAINQTDADATARAEAQAIRTAAIEYDRAVHTHGWTSTQAQIAYRDLNKALRSHGIDSTTEAIEATEADLLAEAGDYHSVAAMLPDDLHETHLSSEEEDGSRWCKNSAECLEQGRRALPAHEIENAKVEAALAIQRDKPLTCTSTHCERRQECAAPRECTGEGKHLNPIIAAMTWMTECRDWLVSKDLDMGWPQDDPTEIVARLAALCTSESEDVCVFCREAPSAHKDRAFLESEGALVCVLCLAGAILRLGEASKLTSTHEQDGYQELRAYLAKLLPVGSADAPGDKVQAFYIRMDELRRLHELVSPTTPQETNSHE